MTTGPISFHPHVFNVCQCSRDLTTVTSPVPVLVAVSPLLQLASAQHGLAVLSPATVVARVELAPFPFLGTSGSGRYFADGINKFTYEGRWYVFKESEGCLLAVLQLNGSRWGLFLVVLAVLVVLVNINSGYGVSLQQVGYRIQPSYEGVYISIPDRQALGHRLHERESIPLP